MSSSSLFTYPIERLNVDLYFIRRLTHVDNRVRIAMFCLKETIKGHKYFGEYTKIIISIPVERVLKLYMMPYLDQQLEEIKIL